MTKIEETKKQETLIPECIDNEFARIVDLDFDADDEFLERFYEHAERCAFHRAMVEKENETLGQTLTALDVAFNLDDEDAHLNWTYLSCDVGLDVFYSHVKELCDQSFERVFRDVNQINRLSWDNWAYKHCAGHTLDFYLSASLTEPKITLLYFGIAAAVENEGVNILSQRLSGSDYSCVRASFDVIASDEQLEKVSLELQNHVGVSSFYVTDGAQTFMGPNLKTFLHDKNSQFDIDIGCFMSEAEGEDWKEIFRSFKDRLIAYSFDDKSFGKSRND